MNRPRPLACSAACSSSVAALPAPDSVSIRCSSVEVVGGERPVAAQLLQRDVVFVGARGRRGPWRGSAEVGADRQPGQCHLGRLAELVLEVGVDEDRLCLRDEPYQRPRTRRRSSSSIGRVTSIHHSSPATSSSSCCCCARPRGCWLTSSRAEAISWTWSRSRSKPGSAASTQSWRRSTSRSKRLAASSSSRTALGQAGEVLGDLRAPASGSSRCHGSPSL